MLFRRVMQLVSSAARGVQGQGPAAEVRGTLSTGRSKSVPAVGVTLQSTSGGLPQFTSTDMLGRFSFDQVPIGSYLILINAPGYAPFTQTIDVAEGAYIKLSITLRSLGDRPVRGKASPNGSYLVSVRQLRIPAKAQQEYEKGIQSAARDKTDDAIKHWERSIKIFPQYAEAYAQLSKVYAARSDFARATEAANHAIDIDGRTADAYLSLGYIYVKEKDFVNAKNAFANAVRLSDSNWFSQYCLGKLLLDGKDVEGAYPHLLRASQLRPQSPDVEIALYNDLVMLGRAKQALAKLDDFLTRFPNSPLAASAREKRKHLVKALAEDEQ
jgi:tetratricopeptide (TPR) repeat protein